MRTGAWLALAGSCALSSACGGTTGAGSAAGGSAGMVGTTAGASAGAGAGGGSNESSAGATTIEPGAGLNVATGGAAAIAGAGGGAGVGPGAAAGGGGASPTSVIRLPPLSTVGAQQQSSKLDVLLVVDNSAQMADKQAILAQSLPAFVSRLVNPPCVDSQGQPVATQPADGTEACASGKRQFTPVTDMHLGVITTSLGSHGGEVCAPEHAPVGSFDDDQAELIATKRDSVPSYQSLGFASFDKTGTTGLSDAVAVTTQLQTMVTSAGQTGCGFEAPLEAMYRFLVDPEPPISVAKNAQLQSASTGINSVLLAQRRAFLRPDSSVAIVILTDENDCSIVDTDVGWFVGSSMSMPKATVACAANPNDVCCRSCAQAESTPPAGCAPLSGDANCSTKLATANYATWDKPYDSLNLRCYDQMRRFGFDLLNPVQRYSVGLTNSYVYNAEGVLVDNPLFAARNGAGPRSPSLVSVSVLIGAPWQDLASEASLTPGSALVYLDGAALESAQRWPLLVGDAANNVPPSDPFMRESIDPRTGTNPLTAIPLVSPTSMNPTANAINGHERNLPNRDDLQYACTFPLAVPKTCVSGDYNCDCAPDNQGSTATNVAENSPLCQPPAGGLVGTTQYYAKATPGTRELVFARALGNRATPASICPQGSAASTGSSSGYVPALNALANRVAATLQ